MSVPAPRLEPRRSHERGAAAELGGGTALRRAKRADGEPRSRPRPTTPAPRARRNKHHLGFALFASTIVGAMVFGIVVLNVLLAQQSFRIDAAERRIEALDREHLELVRQQAALSAPDRISDWAGRHGMRLPDDIRILRAPNGPGDPAGAGTSTAGLDGAAG